MLHVVTCNHPAIAAGDVTVQILHHENDVLLALQQEQSPSNSTLLMLTFGLLSAAQKISKNSHNTLIYLT